MRAAGQPERELPAWLPGETEDSRSLEPALTAIMAREAIYSGKEMTWDIISNA